MINFYVMNEVREYTFSKIEWTSWRQLGVMGLFFQYSLASSFSYWKASSIAFNLESIRDQYKNNLLSAGKVTFDIEQNLPESGSTNSVLSLNFWAFCSFINRIIIDSINLFYRVRKLLAYCVEPLQIELMSLFGLFHPKNQTTQSITD
jgi:hypothetical protein